MYTTVRLRLNMRCFFKVFYYYFDFCFPRVKSRKCTKNEKWITADIVNDKNEIQCLARSNRYSKNVNSNLTLKDKKTKLKKRVLMRRGIIIKQRLVNRKMLQRPHGP